VQKFWADNLSLMRAVIASVSVGFLFLGLYLAWILAVRLWWLAHQGDSQAAVRLGSGRTHRAGDSELSFKPRASRMNIL